MHDVEVGPPSFSDLPAFMELLHSDRFSRPREVTHPEPYRRANLELAADPNQLVVVGRTRSAVVSPLQPTVFAS